MTPEQGPPATEQLGPATKRRLRIHLSRDLIREVLGLPPGHHLVAVETTNDPWSVVAIAEGPLFPESSIDEVSPVAQLHQTVTRDQQTGEVLALEREVRWAGQAQEVCTVFLVSDYEDARDYGVHRAGGRTVNDQGSVIVTCASSTGLPQLQGLAVGAWAATVAALQHPNYEVYRHILDRRVAAQRGRS